LYGEYFRMELGNKFYIGITLIPLFFLFVFGMAGFYADPLRRSRLLEFGKSLVVTLWESALVQQGFGGKARHHLPGSCKTGICI
jgi:hypothetical protein